MSHLATPLRQSTAEPFASVDEGAGRAKEVSRPAAATAMCAVAAAWATKVVIIAVLRAGEKASRGSSGTLAARSPAALALFVTAHLRDTRVTSADAPRRDKDI